MSDIHVLNDMLEAKGYKRMRYVERTGIKTMRYFMWLKNFQREFNKHAKQH